MSKVVKALPEKKKTCPVCGKEFNAYGRQIYCGVQCRNKEMARRANPELKRRAEKTPKGSSPEDPVKDCPKDCRYLGKGTCMRTCDYLLIAGKPRDCEVRPGGCDRYEKNGGQADEKL